MGLKGFERRLERAIEGTFARAFKSGLRPVEVGRRLTREMDDNRSVDVRAHFWSKLLAYGPTELGGREVAVVLGVGMWGWLAVARRLQSTDAPRADAGTAH